VSRLSDLIEPGSDWMISDANDINDAGDIAGRATSISNPRVSVAVLLTPRDA